MFVNILQLLQLEMEEPTAWGWYHIMWLCITICIIYALYKIRKNHSEKQLKMVLGTYAGITLMTEFLKQVSWSFSLNDISELIEFDYTWYSFPFQLCSTPMYVCLICLFLNKSKIRDYLLSYVAYITILGSLSAVFMPDTCLVSDILVNIHTMCLHYGSLVVSIYLLMSGEVPLKMQQLKRGICVFFGLTLFANFLNIIIYNSGILLDETFNMFYISPYFVSELPVFNMIQQNAPYIVFLSTYIITLSLGGWIIYEVARYIQYINKKQPIHRLFHKF